MKNNSSLQRGATEPQGLKQYTYPRRDGGLTDFISFFKTAKLSIHQMKIRHNTKWSKTSTLVLSFEDHFTPKISYTFGKILSFRDL